MIYAEERHNKIMELLSKQGRVDAIELISTLNTSRETIRRDLNKLAEEGKIVKTHGGAILPTNRFAGYDFPFSARQKVHKSEKAEISAFAAGHIGDLETIFLDNSSTAAYIVKFIPRQYCLNILVNSIPLLLTLSQIANPNWNVISLGGSLSYNTVSTGRYLAIDTLKNFKPAKAFFSCHSIDRDLLVTDHHLDDVELKRNAIELSSETYLLADHSKLNHPGVMKIADACDFHHIITNDSADPDFVSKLRTRHCDVQLAPAFS